MRWKTRSKGRATVRVREAVETPRRFASSSACFPTGLAGNCRETWTAFLACVMCVFSLSLKRGRLIICQGTANGKRPEDMSPQELHAVLWKVLSFRDAVAKKISKTIGTSQIMPFNLLQR